MCREPYFQEENLVINLTPPIIRRFFFGDNSTELMLEKRDCQMDPIVVCPKCKIEKPLTNLLTAQSNQNVIFECEHCHFIKRNITTKKG